MILTERRTVRLLSPIVPGRQADRRLNKPLEQVPFPTAKAVIFDSGIEGLKLNNVVLVVPKKTRPEPVLVSEWF